MRDLGLEIEDKSRMFNELINISGCLPHYIQFLAGRLCNLACDENKQKLTLKDFTAVLNEFETASVFQSALAGLDDPYALIVAIRLLDLGSRAINESVVVDILRQEGLPSDPRLARTLCDYLVIQNILSWSGGSFALASQGLKRYARKGILEEMRVKVRRHLMRYREELS